MARRWTALALLLLAATGAVTLGARAASKTDAGVPLCSPAHGGKGRNLWDWEDWEKAEGFISLSVDKEVPELHRAAGSGDMERVTKLLASGADVSSQDRDGWTPLHWAAYEGKTDVVQLLLANGAHAEAKAHEDISRLIGPPDVLPRANPENWVRIHKRTNATPLKAALAKGREGPAAILLALGTGGESKDELLRWSVEFGYAGGAAILLAHGAPVDTPDKDGWTPLQWAARNQRAGVVEVLLAHGANPNARTRPKEFRGRLRVLSPAHQTALHLCGGNAKIARLLLAKGADVNARDANRATPLHLAGGDAKATEILVAHGADVNARDNKGETPLWAAAGYLVTGARDYLIAHGADVNAPNSRGQTLLYAALGYWGSEHARFALDHGADPNVQDKEGRAPLHHLAADCWGTDAVEKGKLLLSRGAAIHAKDRSGATALDLAVQRGNRELVIFLRSQARGKRAISALHDAAARGDAKMVAALLGKGAKVNAAEESGQTPLHLAAGGGHADAARLLLEKGVDVSARDEFGWTPLHKAAWDGLTEMASLLISHGAKLDARTRDGDMPLHLAVRRAEFGTVEFLLSKGADPNAVGSDKSTPFDVAFDIEMEDGGESMDRMIDILEKHGAKKPW